MKENGIEEDIKIALYKFSDNKDIDSAILIVEKFILGNYILRGGRKNIVKDSLRYILSDYKRVLKENEHKTEKIENQKSELAILNDKQKDFNKLQNTLKSYKGQFRRQEKENEKLKNQEATARKVNELLVERYSTSIPVQKVKDKIEEIQEDKTNKYYYMFLEDRDLEYTIEILQELLESEE